MPSAEGFFPEEHEQYVGVYLGSVSSPGCSVLVEFIDYTTVGWTSQSAVSKTIHFARLSSVDSRYCSYGLACTPRRCSILSEQR